jgi:hypothetical protein
VQKNLNTFNLNSLMHSGVLTWGPLDTGLRETRKISRKYMDVNFTNNYCVSVKDTSVNWQVAELLE